MSASPYCEGPDATATTDEESQREYWESLCCDGCSKDFEVHIVSTFSETVVKIPGLVDLTYDVRDFVEEDMAADIESTQQLEIYKKVTRDVISILRKGNDDDVQATLNNMLFAQVVTAVETYLSSSFIATVVNSEELIRRLVETDRRCRSSRPAFASDKAQLSGGRHAHVSLGSTAPSGSEPTRSLSLCRPK